MDADLKRLEDKISKLISLCVTLREENIQLRGNLTQAQQNSDTLKSNMLLASQKLEILLETMPADAVASGTVTTDEEIS
ncbi:MULTISPECIES: hypothetical protein [Methylotenera]|uniref:hypothetical protein n=1 Tax=Methylotenera TaxID=359407 RepID=UPI00036A3699|nr:MULTISPECIES: hypothetical protein [Methylotenera]